MARQRMQLERAVRLMAVQEDRDGNDRDVGQRQRDPNSSESMTAPIRLPL
jgi:hypothetical protein